jgi:signal transduction histidine kinase/DNA-binding response OmpR family regulator
MESEAPSSSSSSSSSSTSHQAKVLLVDDRPENLLAMETVLADLGQDLICAGSGSEALRYLLQEDVALILLDVQMPGLNGFELAELIRERERTQRTPIIFISATSRNEQYVFKGYSLGAVDYLTKPIEPEILKSKVRFFTELFRQNQKIKRQAELLEKTNAALDRLNGELEARVRQRTEQLETANRELQNEIAARKKSEARLATEHAITRALAVSSGLEEAAPLILKAFCEHLPADICSIWLPDETGETLFCRHTEISPEAGDVSLFTTESGRLKFSPGVGLPGQVWQKNAPVWLPNTVRGANFPRASLAATVGLHSAIGFPVKFGGEFYGVIEFFTRRALLFDEAKTTMLESIGSEIGQFIRRKQVEAERENLLRREKALREQAETASRLKDEFLATVSHELRTPLNAILGWGQILQTGKLSEEEKAAALETIYRNARSQAQLIDDLLDTSRLITGNLRLNLSPTKVRPVIEESLDVVRPAAEAKDITLATVYDSEIETIICDSQRLQQMIWNLLTNAVKFTPAGGRIEVRFEQTPSAVQIVVADSGQGITPEFLPFVFDRFRQADSSSTRKHNGLGLGLAIVRHLAELHGGAVRVESSGVGQGSTFIITLPSSSAAATAAAAAIMTPAEIESIAAAEIAPEENSNGYKSSADREPELGGVRVLIVDDDTDTCEMLAFALRDLGAEAQSSSSVAEAFSSLERFTPDVLLTDINMPGEDGYELIKKLRALETAAADIPAIALTAMARPEDGELALSAGFQLHLPKPVDIQQLAEAITSLTKNNRASLSA